MTQKKGLLIDIGVGIIVLMIATIALGVIYNRNIEEGTDLLWTDVNIHIVTNNPELQNSVLVFFNKDELQTTFPEMDGNSINWKTHIALAYVGNIAPATDYSYEIIEGHYQGSVATLKYRFSFLDVSGAFPLELNTNKNHPVLFVAIDREDIDITSQFTFRFQNADTNETHSLTIFENESPTNN